MIMLKGTAQRRPCRRTPNSSGTIIGPCYQSKSVRTESQARNKLPRLYVVDQPPVLGAPDLNRLIMASSCDPAGVRAELHGHNIVGMDVESHQLGSGFYIPDFQPRHAGPTSCREPFAIGAETSAGDA